MGDTSGVTTRLLTGKGRFTADEHPEGALSMVVLRSDIAHGRIIQLDASAARHMPGVQAILTAGQLGAMGIGPIPHRPGIEGIDGPPNVPERPVLAGDRVVHIGQPVAAIVAETREQALDAAEAIHFDMDPLEAVADPLAAQTSAAIWDVAPRNRCLRWEAGNGPETEAAFETATHRVALTVHHPRIVVSPVETRGALATWDERTGYTLVTPSQNVVALRTHFSRMLGEPSERLRVITRDVGGSFAVKIFPYPEQALVLIAARLLGRPVRWQQDREEVFTSDTQGRGRIDDGEIALDGDGRILAVRIRATADLGAFVNLGALMTFTKGAVRPFQQVYDIPAQHYAVTAVFTNAIPTDAYRGAGKPESNGTLERLIEAAAREIGIDPWELRKRNLIRPETIPYSTPMGETIDAGDFPAIARKLEEVADWIGGDERSAKARARGKLFGHAAGFAVHATGGSTEERSEVRALADGTILVRTGSMDAGQSHLESLAIVAGRALDLPPERIRVEQGDSAWLERASGAGGSNLMPVAGNTVHRTARQMLEQARAEAASILEVAEADIEYGAGEFRVIGTDRVVDLAAVALRKEEMDGLGCVAQLDFEGEHTTWPHSAMACEVEVDPDTGVVEVTRLSAVTDIGDVINPPAAFGQIIGGFAQGLGEALMEGMMLDADGQPRDGSLMDYPLPKADDLAMMAHEWAPTDSPNALINAKGVGELSTIGANALVANAVLDALAAYGVRHIDKPITPEKIWRALARARKA